MNRQSAATVLSALAHEGRLSIFRLLVRAGPGGIKAGDVARAIAAPPSTLSANLGILSDAGLIAGRRDGRAIYYAARYDRMRDLLGFLMEDCCNGEPEVCRPLFEVASRATCCAADQAEVEAEAKAGCRD